MRKLRLFLRNAKGFKVVYNFLFWFSNDVIHWKRILIRMYGCRILRTVDEIIRQGGLPVTPYYGTLLGLVREGHLLRHDADMDYAILANEFDLKSFYKSLKEVGFYFERFETINGNLSEFSVRYKEVSVDFFVLSKDRERNVWVSLQPLDSDFVRYEYPDVNAYKDISCSGMTLRVVEGCEQQLDVIYGQWRVVDKNWHGKKSPSNKGSVKNLGYITGHSRNECEWDAYVRQHPTVSGVL